MFVTRASGAASNYRDIPMFAHVCPGILTVPTGVQFSFGFLLIFNFIFFGGTTYALVL